MKNLNKTKNQNLAQFNFNIFLKASPEAMDALMNVEDDEAIVQSRVLTLELPTRRPSHFLSSSNRSLHI